MKCGENIGELGLGSEILPSLCVVNCCELVVLT